MKLLSLLKSLQTEEYKEFEKFLRSPFVKVSEQYLRFFKCLCKHAPSFELKKADLEAAYRRCFGPQSLTADSRLYNIMSGLSKQLEQFLVVRMVLVPEGREQERLYQQLLVKSLGLRNNGPHFRAKAQQLIDNTVALPVKEIDDYLMIQQLHYEIYFNPDTPKLAENPPHIQLAAEYLDLYYCMAKLRYAAEMKTRERIFDLSYKLPFLDAVMAYSASPELLEIHPILSIYHYLVDLYRQGVEEPGFRTLMAVFTEKFHLLNRVDQAELLRHLINCGISLINKDCAVQAELLALYKIAIEANLLLNGDRITHVSFININSLACRCQEFDWAKGFIKQFAPYLEENKRQPSIDLAKATIYYGQGLFDKAQTSLKPEIFLTPNFDILGRTLLIKIVFDRYILQGKDYTFLTAQINSFERYIPQQSISSEKRKAELNWVKFVRKMATLKFELVEVPESKKALLRSKLKPMQPVVNKKWLEEKIKAL